MIPVAERPRWQAGDSENGVQVSCAVGCLLDPFSMGRNDSPPFGDCLHRQSTAQEIRNEL